MPTSSLSSSSDSCTCSGNGLNLKPSWNTSSYISSYTTISSSKSLGSREKAERTKKFSEAREKKLIENWRKRKEKKKSKNQEAEAKLKNERKENLKRKQEVWKEQVEKSKRRKLNPPIAAIREEDDEKQPEEEEEEDQNEPSVLVEVDSQSQIDNQSVENPEQSEGDLSDFEDIFAPKRKDNNKHEDVHFDNLKKFLDGFDDEELEDFL